MLSRLSIPLVLLLSLGACSSEESAETNDDERADSTEVIEYRRPDAPTVIEFDEELSATNRQSLAFGHCDDEATIGEDDSINISCPQKWSELAWLSIPKESTEALIAEGKTRLQFDLFIPVAAIEEGENLRFGMRSVAEDGTKTKVISQNHLLDGSSFGLELAASDYEIFIARGVNQFRRWPNGVIEFELATSAQ